LALSCASIIPILRGGEKHDVVQETVERLTRTLLSNMLLCPMKRRRKVTRPVPVMSPSARLSLLSSKRQAIIRPTFERPREFVLLSVRALAQRLGTDPATMIRIVRGMQFGSYREFQHYVHELSIAHATSLDTMQTGPTGKSAISAQARASLDQDTKNMNRLAHSLDSRRIAALVRRLYSARRVVLLGGDLAANLVKFLEHLLIILGLPVTSATSPAEVVHKVRPLGKQDLVIAVSYGRGLRQTVEGLRQARANGAHCVGITNTLVSPIGEFAHESFLTSIETPSFGSSYVAPMALFNVIVVACANHRRSRTLSLMKQLEQEQRHGFRWYES
jgi:DNA-binding MurR/RpiR family transcriptional regulator